MKRHVLGDEGPVLVLDRRACALLWPAVDAWVRERARVGARRQLSAAFEIVEAWRLVAEGGRASAPLAPGSISGSSSSPHELSTADAAQELGCGAQHVRRLCRDGALDARRVGRDWLIDRNSVAARANERGRTDLEVNE